ncbi:MAG: glycosyltransferase family 2 protein [Chloroflexota bacterium]
MLSISVVTPSLNQARFVERTIHSVLDQTPISPLEYVVQDGGSTDGTLAILERFSGRLRVTSEPDRGQAEAVNKGIRSTRGEVIGWLNSDDVYYPGALAAVAAFFSAHPMVDLMYGDAQLLDAEDRLLGAYYTEPWNPARLVERCFLCQPAVFFRRRIVERFGMLDERLHYCLDYEYWLRLAAGGAAFAYAPGVLAGSRLHPATKTSSAGLVMHDEINAMLRARLGRVPASWLINNAHTRVSWSRTNGSRPIAPYALEVVGQAMVLSWRWNRAVSSQLLTGLLRPIVSGAKRRVLPTLFRSP